MKELFRRIKNATAKENRYNVRWSSFEDYLRDFREGDFTTAELNQLLAERLTPNACVVDLFSEQDAIVSLLQVLGNERAQYFGYSVSLHRAVQATRKVGRSRVDHLVGDLSEKEIWKILGRLSYEHTGFDIVLSRAGSPAENLDRTTQNIMIDVIPMLLSENGIALLQLPPSWKLAQSYDAIEHTIRQYGKNVYLKDNVPFTTMLMTIPGTLAIITPPHVQPKSYSEYASW